MGKFFTGFATVIFLLLGVGQAMWLWKAWNVTVNDVSMPLWVPIAGLAIALITSLGLAAEAFSRRGESPRSASTSGDAISRDVQRRPSKFTVKHGRRYKATISLGFFEQVASNDMIAEKLGEAGFKDISVSGSGGAREAIGRWDGADTSAEMPSQVVSAVEIVEPTVTASLTSAAATLSRMPK